MISLLIPLEGIMEACRHSTGFQFNYIKQKDNYIRASLIHDALPTNKE